MSLNVQIINQSEDLCSTLCRFFRSEGHKAVCDSQIKRPGCSSAKSAESKIQKQYEDCLDLIIIEVDMPETDAIEMVKQLHRSAATKNIPIIVISDFPELEFEFLHIFDFICKPVDLGRLRENVSILQSGARTRDASIKFPTLSNEDHLKFHDFLILHSGLHFERRNIKVLERGLVSRMTALHINSFSSYYDYLCKNKECRQELQKLLQHLTVGETFFFRYHAHFEALVKSVLPDLMSRRADKRLRIWSAGCSTGEEPYSIAMAIMELIPDWKKWDVRIHATDINSRSLKRAKEGVYNDWKIRVTPKHYLEKYFRQIGESFLVRDEVKALVDFSYFNLQSVPPPADKPFDIIFCRNVMIYFTTATTKKVVDRFADSLGPGGYLFLGHSETLSHISSKFERHIQAGGFYYKKKGEPPPLPEKAAATNLHATPAGSARPEPAIGLPEKAARPPVDRPAESSNPEALFAKGLSLMHQEDYAAAAAAFNTLLQMVPDHTGAILAVGQIHLAGGRSDEAVSCFDRALAINDLLPEGYLLRGLSFEMNDSSDAALNEYRKAVLLKMDFIMPHYQLGKLCFRTGDIKASEREFKNCIRLLEKAAREAEIPFSGGLSREVFLERARKEMAIVAAAKTD